MDEPETTNTEPAQPTAEALAAQEHSEAETFLLANMPDMEGYTGGEQAPEAAPAEGAADLTQGEDYVKALAALERGLPKSVREKTIEAMTPEQILSDGTAYAESQAEQDRQGNLADRLEKRLEALEGPKEEGPGEVEGGDAAQPTESEANALDISEALQPLDPDLYEGLPQTLTEVAQQIDTHLRADFGKQLTAIRTQADEKSAALEAGFDQYVQGDVRRRLADMYPGLRDQKVFEKVAKHMREIAPAMEHAEGALLFDRHMATMTRAAEFTLGKAKESPGISNQSTGPGGQPPAPSPHPAAATAKMTHDEQSAVFLQSMFDGGNVTAAKRASGFQ